MMRAKIDDKFIIFAQCDKLPGYCLEEALDWLQTLYQGAYRECQKIRNMQSEAVWKKYELWADFDDCNEVKLYAAKLDAFRNHCKHRPLIFRHSACEKAITENERAKPKKKAKKERHED